MQIHHCKHFMYGRTLNSFQQNFNFLVSFIFLNKKTTSICLHRIPTKLFLGAFLLNVLESNVHFNRGHHSPRKDPQSAFPCLRLEYGEGGIHSIIL